MTSQTFILIKSQTDMKVVFKQLHLWLSIPIGLVITVVCFTGAILVFQQDILEWSNPSHYFVKEPGEKVIPLDQLVPMVNKQLDNNTVASVQIPSDSGRTYTMTLKEGFRVSAFVDPYTGEVKGYYYFQKTPFYTIMVLHRWLLDGTRTWGKYIVGVSTLLFVFILITGLLLQPTLFKGSLWKIHTKKGFKRLLHDLHNTLGLYAFIILVIGALTGLMWSFEWYRDGIYKLFGAEVAQKQSGNSIVQQGGNAQRNGGVEKEELLSVIHWQNVLDELRILNPENSYIRIQKGSATVHQKSAPTSRANDTYLFDNHTGIIGAITLYKDTPKTSRIFGWAYSLHVGDFWGMWSKIPTFLAALVGASLPLTGYWIYFRKLSHKQRRKKNASATVEKKK